jgi:hypothetical protein
VALQHNYTIICEFARMEFGGKWILIGLFPNGVAAPLLPFAMPSLTFFQMFTPESPGQYHFKAELRHAGSQNLIAQAKGVIPAPRLLPTLVPVTIANVQFRETGPYEWSFHIEGQDPFLFEFPVFVTPPQPQFPIPGMGR